MNEREAKEYDELGPQGGRGGGGDSGGGPYPNSHSGKEPEKEGPLARGGQTGMAYHGGANPNAPASDRADEGSGDEPEG